MVSESDGYGVPESSGYDIRESNVDSVPASNSHGVRESRLWCSRVTLMLFESIRKHLLVSSV
jgi:hypothetical protein